MADTNVTSIDEAPIAFRVEGKKKSSVNVELVGVRYRVMPPKSMVALNMGRKLGRAGEDLDAVMVELGAWVRSIFGKEAGGEVMKRLVNPEDDLDLDDIMELVRVMAERQTGNPTS